MCGMLRATISATECMPIKPLNLWDGPIAKSNWSVMQVSLGLVFGLDLVILLLSGFSLLPFWIVMLVVLGVFALCVYYENVVLRKSFGASSSPYDAWIYRLVTLRNIFFLINFIPLVQVFGLIVLQPLLVLIEAVTSIDMMVGGGFSPYALAIPVYLVLYFALIVARRRQVSIN